VRRSSILPHPTSSLDWLGTFAGFYRREKSHDFAAAKELTRVERIHPTDGFVERTDGALIGMVQVTPPTMALATDGQWRTTAEAFQNFLNTTVAYPIQIFSTTQAFPTEEYLAHYENRLTDPDVQANPHLQTLIEEYIAWYTAEMSQRKMTIRDHYIVVPVTPAEVQFERERCDPTACEASGRWPARPSVVRALGQRRSSTQWEPNSQNGFDGSRGDTGD